MKMRTVFSLVLTTVLMLTIGCAPYITALGDTPRTEDTLVEPDTLPTSTPAPLSEPTAPADQPIKQTRLDPIIVGPDPEDVPAGYNPLTGLPVSDPSTLDLPAVLISITNFPPSARPQAGLSFSP